MVLRALEPADCITPEPHAVRRSHLVVWTLTAAAALAAAASLIEGIRLRQSDSTYKP